MGKSLKERLKEKRENLKKAGPGKFFTVKEGVTRIRILPVGREKDWGMEVIYFFMGVKDDMGVISPATFSEKCAIMEAHVELTESKKEKEREQAKKFRPQRKFLIPVIRYKDERGEEIDHEAGVKLMLISQGVYQEMLDLWLDPDNGDFTDPKEGYDLKIKRSGKGKNDTEYKVMAGKPRKLDKKYRNEVDLEKMVRDIVPSYKATKSIIEKYFNLPPEKDNGKDKNRDKKKKKKNRDL